MGGLIYSISHNLCLDLRLDKISKVLIKTMIIAEVVESKHSTKLKHQE